jgi:hypothetical protein
MDTQQTVKKWRIVITVLAMLLIVFALSDTIFQVFQFRRDEVSGASVFYLVYQTWLLCVGILGVLSTVKQHILLAQLFVGGLIISLIAAVINFPFSLDSLNFYVETTCQKEKFDKSECDFVYSIAIWSVIVAFLLTVLYCVLCILSGSKFVIALKKHTTMYGELGTYSPSTTELTTILEAVTVSSETDT